MWSTISISMMSSVLSGVPVMDLCGLSVIACAIAIACGCCLSCPFDEEGDDEPVWVPYASEPLRHRDE